MYHKNNYREPWYSCPYGCNTPPLYDTDIVTHINKIHPDSNPLSANLLPTDKFRYCNSCHKLFPALDKHRSDKCRIRKQRALSSSTSGENSNGNPPNFEIPGAVSVTKSNANSNIDTIVQPGDPLSDPVSEKDPNYSTNTPINYNNETKEEIAINNNLSPLASLTSAPNPNTDPEEYIRITELCTPHGDGNCGPRSISVLLYNGDEEHHRYVREQGIKYLRNRINWKSNQQLATELMKRFWIDNFDNEDTYAAKILSYADKMNKNGASIDSDVTMISIAYALNKRIRIWMLNYSKDKGIYLHPNMDWNSDTIPEDQTLDIVYAPGHYKALIRAFKSIRHSKQIAEIKIQTSDIATDMEIKEMHKSPMKSLIATRSRSNSDNSSDSASSIIVITGTQPDRALPSEVQREFISHDYTSTITPTAIANHDKLLAKIPHPCYSLWIENCRRLFTTYIKASVENDHQTKLDMIIQLLYLPQKVLKSNSLRFQTKRQYYRSANTIISRLTDNLKQLEHTLSSTEDPNADDDFDTGANNTNAESDTPTIELIESKTESDTYRYNGRSVLTPPTENQKSYITDNINHMKYYLANGYIGRAAKALTQQTSLVNLNDEHRLQQLLDFHPIPQPDDVDYHTNLPRCPSNSPSIIIDADESFIKCIKELANGSAPGASGWTGEMGKVLSRDDTCLKGLAVLINDIINGNLPDKAKDYLLASRLIAIDKDQGNSLRPIAVGEYFYRLAASRQIKQVANQISKILLPIQYGVGISGGCEHVIHTVQHALENQRSPLAALAIDFKNAFNSISRRAILRSLYNQPELESLYKLVDFSYSKPSTLFVNTGDNGYNPLIQSSQGVKQGCPLSALLFALAVQPVYKAALEAQLNKPHTVTAKAILDDCTLIGPATHLQPVYESIQHLALSINLQVQPSKCKLLYFHNLSHPLDDTVTNWISREEIPLEQSVTILLGAPIGLNTKDIDKLALEHIKKHDIFFHSLQNNKVSTQEAMLLLRVCGIPRMKLKLFNSYCPSFRFS
jgi:hypothetical protein